jgi:putative transposase
MQTKFTELTDSQWQVIKKIIEKEQRKRKYSLRQILNAVLWLTRTGSQWRNMESKYPKWELIYYYFRKWRNDGTIKAVLNELVRITRCNQGREDGASMVAIDSQSVKKVSFIHMDTGIDGGKRVNGRKRHIAVDSQGLPLAISVSAANMHDSEGAYDLLWRIEEVSSRVELIRVDGAYKGEFSDVVTEIYQWKIDISQKPESVKGFVPQTGRWQVERSFGWLNFYRRLAKDYERIAESSMAFIQLAFSAILFARIT